MATKRRNLFLYLTLACFFGLIAIFIVDGYMGIYDTVYITAGEREQKIEPDTWQRQDKFWSAGVNRGEKAFFRYEVANRQFSSYTADIEVSAWRMQEKVRDLAAEPIAIAAFDEGQVEWVIDATELLPEDIPPEQSYEFTVIIKRGEIERNIIVRINPVPYQVKPAPVPPR
jgi:putative lipase involved disintegration of autophagic bodies